MDAYYDPQDHNFDYLDVQIYTENASKEALLLMIDQLVEWAIDEGFYEIAKAVRGMPALIDGAIEEGIDIQRHSKMIAGALRQAEQLGYVMVNKDD